MHTPWCSLHFIFLFTFFITIISDKSGKVNSEMLAVQRANATTYGFLLNMYFFMENELSQQHVYLVILYSYVFFSILQKQTTMFVSVLHKGNIFILELCKIVYNFTQYLQQTQNFLTLQSWLIRKADFIFYFLVLYFKDLHEVHVHTYRPFGESGSKQGLSLSLSLRLPSRLPGSQVDPTQRIYTIITSNTTYDCSLTFSRVPLKTCYFASQNI